MGHKEDECQAPAFLPRAPLGALRARGTHTPAPASFRNLQSQIPILFPCHLQYTNAGLFRRNRKTKILSAPSVVNYSLSIRLNDNAANRRDSSVQRCAGVEVGAGGEGAGKLGCRVGRGRHSRQLQRMSATRKKAPLWEDKLHGAQRPLCLTSASSGSHTRRSFRRGALLSMQMSPQVHKLPCSPK